MTKKKTEAPPQVQGTGEQLHNPGFNPVEFDGIKSPAGPNSPISIREVQTLTFQPVQLKGGAV